MGALPQSNRLQAISLRLHDAVSMFPTRIERLFEAFPTLKIVETSSNAYLRSEGVLK